MNKFEEQKFSIPELKGISAKSVEEHLKLYSGYVKNANLVLEKIEEYKADSDPSTGSTGSPQASSGQEKHAYALGELQRRFAFEFDGMRNHEYYFSSLEGGAQSISDGPLKQKIEEEWGSFDVWLNMFKSIALTRGVGWVWLMYDKETDRLLTQWVDEQHLGHLMGTSPILGLDMWEHSFVFDYQPSGKKQYVEDFFANLNWSKIEENFIKATR